MINFESSLTCSDAKIATATISSITEALENNMRKVGQVFEKMGVMVTDATGEFRNLGEVYKEAYNKLEDEGFCMPQKVDEPIATWTFGTFDILNHKRDFDFLHENAYNYIIPIFSPILPDNNSIIKIMT